ncbi:hypothetical protein SAMN04244573_04646, partial [Azotobacter beijerinckii]
SRIAPESRPTPPCPLDGFREGSLRKDLERGGFETLPLTTPEALPSQVEQVFEGGAQVIFDTTGFWLAAAVPALATFGRVAIIAAPADGQVQLPVLDLYRLGGSVVGINSLLYGGAECARMLERFGRHFDDGTLSAPEGLIESPLAEGRRVMPTSTKGAARR